MSKPVLAVGGILLLGLSLLCLMQRGSEARLRGQNQALQQQVEALTAEYERLSNTVTSATSSPSLPEDQLAELLKLRSEVSLLRSRTNGGALPDLSTPKIGQLEILSARFASGTNAADVTARVIELLHREPAGFSARADWLKVDPAPYRNKTLVIIYNYGGRQNLYTAAGGEKVSYEVLVANAAQ